MVTDGDWLVKCYCLLRHIFRCISRLRQTCIYSGFHLTCWFGEPVTISGKNWRVKKDQSGTGYRHSVTTTTRILTGRVACSTGVPYSHKDTPRKLSGCNRRNIKKRWRKMKERKCAWKTKVLNPFTIRTLAAVSIPVCKVFIAPEMMLIWLYLAICCDVLKHHGEFCKS